MSIETMPTPAEGEMTEKAASERLEDQFAALLAMVRNKYPEDADLRDQILALQKESKDAEREATLKQTKAMLAEVPDHPGDPPLYSHD